MVNIGRKLRELRKFNKLSQSALGEIMGVSYQQIQKYEKNISSIDPVKLYELAQRFNVSIEYFFGETEITNFTLPEKYLISSYDYVINMGDGLASSVPIVIPYQIDNLFFELEMNKHKGNIIVHFNNRRFQGSEKKLIALQVTSNAMSPKLEIGDTVVIELGLKDRIANPDSIYLVRKQINNNSFEYLLSFCNFKNINEKIICYFANNKFAPEIIDTKNNYNPIAGKVILYQRNLL